MSESDQKLEKEELLSGLRQDAQSRAVKIAKEADDKISAAVRSVEAQIARIVEEEAKRAKQQIEVIRKRAAVKASADEKRNQLHLQHAVLERVTERVEESLANLVESPEYPELVIGWIVEGAIALDASCVTVETSKAERAIVESVLSEASKRARTVADRDVRIEMSESSRGGSTGVVLHDPERNHDFDNSVATRLLRYRSEIQRTIYSALFESGTQ